MAETNEDQALLAIAHMKQERVIDLDADLAIYSAKIGKDNRLALVDSIIYATFSKYDCTLWTQDQHFKGLKTHFLPGENHVGYSENCLPCKGVSKKILIGTELPSLARRLLCQPFEIKRKRLTDEH